MASRKKVLSEGEYYHIYNRGVNKNIIFHNDIDYERFTLILRIANCEESFHLHNLKKEKLLNDFLEKNSKKPLVAIGAYVLMPNHFHILVKEIRKNGISKFMKKVSISYAMYYNQRYERTGALFEGRFKSSHVDTDEYLKYLFAYIYMNPLKLKDKDWKTNVNFRPKEYMSFLKKYKWSSFNNIELRSRYKEFPNYFNESKSETLQKHVLNWINIHIER